MSKDTKLLEKAKATFISDGTFLLGNREVISDYYVEKSIENEPENYKYKIFVRLNARKKTFKKVAFDHCIFDGCYLNHCVFDSCVFIGCKFIGCNLNQTSFAGCKFDYALFERTIVDDDILESEAPLEENLRMKFARSLRTNYQQIGDAKAVNRSVSIELNATSVYLYKSWSSNENYYRTKYPGYKKIKQFFLWVEFWILDFIWGNGESILKLLRTLLLVILLIGFIDTFNNSDSFSVRDYYQGLSKSFGIFFGLPVESSYSELSIALIAALKLTLFALFTALLVKRFGRR